MKKNIKVIITNKNLHKNPIDRIQTVSRGYAFNYLIPNKIAEIATPKKIHYLNHVQNLKLQQNNKIYNDQLKTKKQIEKVQTLYIKKKASSNKQIFGRLLEIEIVEHLLELSGQYIEKKQIRIEPIKEIGKYTCCIIITDQINTQIEINILPYNL